jgi:hypothetical protein
MVLYVAVVASVDFYRHQQQWDAFFDEEDYFHIVIVA